MEREAGLGVASPPASRSPTCGRTIETASIRLAASIQAQGFEFDYIGVIFGKDLVYDPAADRPPGTDP